MAITVTRSTQLDELQKLAPALDENARLVGKRDGQGNIILYQSKNADPGLWSRLTGRAAEKRALAREAVQQTLANTFPSTTATDATLCSVRRMLNANQSREVRAGELALLGKLAAMAPKAGESWLAQAKPDPIKLSVLEAGFAAMEEGGKHLPAVADNFATYLAGLFKAGGGDAQAFALSDGRAFKGDLLRHLGDEFGKKHALAKLDAKGVDGFLSSVFYRTAAKVLESQVSGDTLTFGGEKYVRKAEPASEGSDGVRVERFSGPNGKQVAVKFFPNLDNAEIPGGPYAEEKKRRTAQRMMEREVEAFAGAASGRHPNVLGYGGVVRTPAGEVGIVMEYAPHGTLGDIAGNIEKALAGKNISSKAAMAVKIAILRDMVEGMAHLHGKKDLAHLDFKPQNCFVAEGGICKVADFGRSIEAGKFSITEDQLPDTFEYVAPEAHSFEAARRKLAFDAVLHGSVLSSKVRSEDRRMATAAADDIQARQGSELLERQSDIDGKKLDAWALGSAMFTIVFGRDIAHSDPSGKPMRSYEVRDALVKLRAEPEKRVVDTVVRDAGPQGNAGRIDDGAFAGSSGNSLVDDLINRLMDPDPRTRLSLDKARDHPLFAARGIGNANCRRLLVELAAATPDQARLQALSLRL